MRRYLPGLFFFFFFVSLTLASADRPPARLGDFKTAVHLDAVLTYTLRTAPLSAEERQRIYALIDNKTIHDSFPETERASEQVAVLGSHVGFVSLAANGSQQMLVQDPTRSCGATGNCSLYVFVKQQGRWRLALTAGGSMLIIEKGLRHGLHDLATYWNVSADEGQWAVYRWDGTKYREIDCYGAKYDLDQMDKAPVFTECPSRQ